MRSAENSHLKNIFDVVYINLIQLCTAPGILLMLTFDHPHSKHFPQQRPPL